MNHNQLQLHILLSSILRLLSYNQLNIESDRVNF